MADDFDLFSSAGGDDFIHDAGSDAQFGDGGTSAVGGGFDSGGGFWNGLLNSFSSPQGIRSIIGAGTQLLGAGIGTVANNNAASTANAATLQAAAIKAASDQAALDKILAANEAARGEYRAAADRGIGYIDKGTADYAGTISPLLTPAPIVNPTYRGLTAPQRTAREDLRRQGAATLAASGLRGAGRAGVGAIMDQDRRFVENAVDRNTADTIGEQRRASQVSNNARSGLAQVQAQAGGAKANTELQTGNQLGASLASGGQSAGQITQSTGNTTAAAVADTGRTDAQAGLSNANLWGGALSNIGGAFSTPYTLSDPRLGSYGAYGSV